MRISSALSEVLVFLCRLRRCRRTADPEMPRTEAITSFFKPLQQSVRTSISRRVSLRQRASDSIAPLANGGNRASLPALTRPRRGSRPWLGQSAHTPWKSAQKSRLSPIEVDVGTSPRSPERDIGSTAPENKPEREGFEPPVPFGTAVFKTAAFSRSATSPLYVVQRIDCTQDTPAQVER